MKRGRSQSTSNTASSPLGTDTKKSKSRKIDNGFRLTKKLAVERLEPVQTIPSTWPVPRDNAAYLVDFAKVSLPKTNKGAQMTMDAFIRHEVHL